MNDKKEISSSPLVSILLCTYNGGQFLPMQLDTLIAQTYGNIEIIAVDDCSTDNSFEILEAYQKKCSFLKAFRNNTNQGFEKNFNDICLLAAGYYLAFCDQDDIWHKDKIKKMIEHWVKGTNLMYCNSHRFLGDLHAGNIKKPIRYRRFQGTDGRKISIFNTISGHAMIIKKDFLELIHPFPSKLFYDWWAGLVAAYNGGVAYLDEVLVYQRVHNNNISIADKKLLKQKKYVTDIHQLTGRHILHFTSAPNMPEDHKAFFLTLYQYWNKPFHGWLNFELFFFLMANRKLIYNHKIRTIGFISHFKRSIILSKRI